MLVGQSKDVVNRIKKHFGKSGKLSETVKQAPEIIHKMKGSTKLEREIYEQFVILKKYDGKLSKGNEIVLLINKVNPVGGRFKIIYKLNGLEACKNFVDNKKIKTGFDYLDIFTPTLQKLLKNEFLSLKELINFDSSIEEEETNKYNGVSIKHAFFYKEEKNKYGLNDDVFVNCVFINDLLLKR